METDQVTAKTLLFLASSAILNWVYGFSSRTIHIKEATKTFGNNLDLSSKISTQQASHFCIGVSVASAAALVCSSVFLLQQLPALQLVWSLGLAPPSTMHCGAMDTTGSARTCMQL